MERQYIEHYDWFRQSVYRDTLEYIEMVGCSYFYNEIPLDFLGL